MSSESKKILLIGWDAADWKVIHPLLDAGKMPNLSRLVEQGTSGNIATLQPALSPMLWTSIATGKRPFKHGVHGFSEPDPVSGSIRPVTNLSRKTKAIWNILNQEGMHTITVGWWPSNPAEPLSKGVMVSDDFQKSFGPPDDWPMKPGTIHPERLAEKLKELRFHKGELEEQDLRPFLPGLNGLPPEDLEKASKDPRMQSLMKIIADCTSIHSAATALMQNEPWDLMCVYFDAIDHFGHGFMKYHPPQRRGVDNWEYRVFNHVIEAGYRYHDMMLGTLMHLAGEDTTVILMSDHGFHPDDFRLSSVPREPAGPAAEHRQFGILAVMGPGIKKDARIYGASLLDICPTLLHRFGLPVGEDMDGKVLLDLYEDTEKGFEAPFDSRVFSESSANGMQSPSPQWAVRKIPSWDVVEGDHGMHPPDRQIAPADSKAALDQLVALGYIEEPDADRSLAIARTVRELDYNLAQSYIDGGIFTQAVAILEKLYEAWPMEHRFGFKLATCFQSLGRAADLREIVTTVTKRRMEEAEEAREELKKSSPADKEAAKAEADRIAALPETEKHKFLQKRRELWGKANPNLFSLRYLEACADFSERKYEAALGKLAELDSEYGARRNALTLRGEILQRLQRWDASRAAFEQALEFDREAPGPLLGLARTALGERKFDEAADFARSSIGLLYFQPRAHYLQGLALYRAGHWQEAEAALEVSASQSPLAAPAWRLLGEIARLFRRDAMLEQQIRLRLRDARERQAALRRSDSGDQLRTPIQLLRSSESREDRPMPVLKPRPEALEGVPPVKIITIVSGLPRSGTSLMMQLLEAADFPLFTDGKRLADGSNQKGYHEHDRVSSLMTAADRKWLAETPGHALKIVAPLLAFLPPQPSGDGVCYRVIFMERDMAEILESQETMLARLGKPAPGGDVAKAYFQQVRHAKNWINTHGIPALSISHRALIEEPEAEIAALLGFLGSSALPQSLMLVIDPALHRAKARKPE